MLMPNARPMRLDALRRRDVHGEIDVSVFEADVDDLGRGR
jgi:hypothetical protein